MSEKEMLEYQYKMAMIEIAKQLPNLISAMRELSLKIERHINLGR